MKVILNFTAPKLCSCRMVKIIYVIAFISGCGTHSARSTLEHNLPPLNVPAGNFYRIRAGDTLFSLAWKNNTTVDNLQKINGLKPDAILRVGQSIRLTGDPERLVNSREEPARAQPLKSCCIKKQPQISEPIKKYDVNGWAKGWIWPVKGEVISGYSVKGGLNKGIDIKTKLGESVVAASDGEVVFAGNELKGYPNLVIVKHGARYLSAYSNNQTLLVKEGDKVRKGQPIAQLGGVPGAARLHFEIRSDGKPVDPQQLLP